MVMRQTRHLHQSNWTLAAVVLIMNLFFIHPSLAKLQVIQPILGNEKSTIVSIDDGISSLPTGFAVKSEVGSELRFDYDNDGFADRVLIESGSFSIEKLFPVRGQFSRIRVKKRLTAQTVEAELQLEKNQRDYSLQTVTVREIRPLYAPVYSKEQSRSLNSSIRCELIKAKSTSEVLNTWAKLIGDLSEEAFLDDEAIRTSVDPSCGAGKANILRSLAALFGPKRKDMYFTCMSQIQGWNEKGTEILLRFVLDIRQSNGKKIVTCVDDLPEGNGSRFANGTQIELATKLAIEPDRTFEKEIFHEALHAGGIDDHNTVELLERCCADEKEEDVGKACDELVATAPPFELAKQNASVSFLLNKLESLGRPRREVIGFFRSELANSLRKAGCVEQSCNESQIREAVKKIRESTTRIYCSKINGLSGSDCSQFQELFDASSEKIVTDCSDSSINTTCLLGLVTFRLETFFSTPNATVSANAVEATQRVPFPEMNDGGVAKPFIANPRPINPRNGKPLPTTPQEVVADSKSAISRDVRFAKTLDPIIASVVPSAGAETSERRVQTASSSRSHSGSVSGRRPVEVHSFPAVSSNDRGTRANTDGLKPVRLISVGNKFRLDAPQFSKNSGPQSQRSNGVQLSPPPIRSLAGTQDPGSTQSASNEPIKPSSEGGGRSIASVPRSTRPVPDSTTQPSRGSAVNAPGGPFSSARRPAALAPPTSQPARKALLPKSERIRGIIITLEKTVPHVPPKGSELLRELDDAGVRVMVGPGVPPIGPENASTELDWQEIRKMAERAGARK